MKKFFQKICNPKVWLPCLAAFVGLQIFGMNIAFAVEPDKTGKEALEAFAQFLSVFVNILVFLALKLLEVGGKVMGTEYITGEAPMQAIRPMWVIIRNFTNIGFVVVLLFLAFSNLFSSFGGEGGNWTIKDKLPKVIIALVAINFSLLGFRVVIDAVNVGMVSILTITDTVNDAKNVEDLKQLLDGQSLDREGKTCTEGPDCKTFSEWINELMCESKDVNNQDCMFLFKTENIPADATHNNILLAFSIHFQGLKDLVMLSASTNSFTNVAEHVIFSAILVVAYMAALIAVFIAMLARIVVLWIAMVFSPLLIAAAVMGFDEGGGSKISEMVITHLIMPLKIAAAFTVCFVMMSAMNGIGFSQGDMIQVGKVLSGIAEGGPGLLWKIATIVVFWKTAFWALEGSAAESITNYVKSGAESLGGYAARAATIDRQLFKLPDGTPVSLATLKRFPDVIDNMRKDAKADEFKAFSKFVGGEPPDEKLEASVKELKDSFSDIPNMTKQGILEAFKKSNFAAISKFANEKEDKLQEAVKTLTGKELDETQLQKLKGGDVKQMGTVMESIAEGANEKSTYFADLKEKPDSKKSETNKNEKTMLYNNNANDVVAYVDDEAIKSNYSLLKNSKATPEFIGGQLGALGLDGEELLKIETEDDAGAVVDQIIDIASDGNSSKKNELVPNRKRLINAVMIQREHIKKEKEKNTPTTEEEPKGDGTKGKKDDKKGDNENKGKKDNNDGVDVEIEVDQ